MKHPIFACAFALALSLSAAGADEKSSTLTEGSHKKSEIRKSREKLPAVLWNDPADIASRNLFWGQGGEKGAPGKGPFRFFEEDRDGNSPKVVVKDESGAKWKVKLGAEARPETVATRLVWAVGYSTDEDYFEPAMRVENMPKRLRRGGEYVTDGVVHDARWERMDHKKADRWRWRSNDFSKTRELNGLRVMMSLLDNYDMKDSQNAVYAVDGSRLYVVADLGATFGTTGSSWPGVSSKGNLSNYAKADFIKKVTPTYVDFSAPSWPMMFGFLPVPPLPYSWFTLPFKLIGKPPATNVWTQRWIGKHIPREDARWIGSLLRRLSAPQIRDAFRAGHYSEADVEGFSKSVERRIAQLGEL